MLRHDVFEVALRAEIRDVRTTMTSRLDTLATASEALSSTVERRQCPEVSTREC